MFILNSKVDDNDMLMAETPHRKFFTEVLTFEKVVDFKDEDIVRLIHFTFRLLYLRDCALGHFLDDRSMNLITIVFLLYNSDRHD